MSRTNAKQSKTIMRAPSISCRSCVFYLILTVQIRESQQWALLPSSLLPDNEKIGNSGIIRRSFFRQSLDREQKERIVDTIRQSAGDALTVVGLLRSINESLVANPTIVMKISSAYQTLYEYLHSNKIDVEISGVLNARFADNWTILGIIQQRQQKRQALLLGGGEEEADRRDALLSSITANELVEKFTLEETKRYARYAVAAYGDTVIDAANVDMGTGEIDLRQGDDWTKTRVSEHIGIPETDLVLVDTRYTGDATQLRHFVAIDHENRKVVVAIRGTFTYSEVAADLFGHSRPFCGGEAHAGIALMTERLWEHTGDTVLNALDDNAGYELILVGHSLGGGTTLLLNLLLHQEAKLCGRRIRAFAFAAPPVFSPMSRIPEETLHSAVHYIHQKDEVPFLSGNSVRHQIAALAAIDSYTKDMELTDRARLLLGLDGPSEELVKDVEDALYSPLAEKPGMPLMTIPAMASVWVWEKGAIAGKYDMKVCDPMLLAKTAIHVDDAPDSLFDHYPTRYERAFANIDGE